MWSTAVEDRQMEMSKTFYFNADLFLSFCFREVDPEYVAKQKQNNNSFNFYQTWTTSVLDNNLTFKLLYT